MRLQNPVLIFIYQFTDFFKEIRPFLEIEDVIVIRILQYSEPELRPIIGRETILEIIFFHQTFIGRQSPICSIIAKIKQAPYFPAIVLIRSEERRVGKECRSRWWA